MIYLRVIPSYLLLPLSTLLAKFRTEALADGAIATTCWFAGTKKNEKDKSTTPEEWGPFPEPTVIVWDETTGTLLHVDTPDAIDENADEMEVRMALLDRYVARATHRCVHLTID